MLHPPLSLVSFRGAAAAAAAQLSLSELAGRGLERAGWGWGRKPKVAPLHTRLSLSFSRRAHGARTGGGVAPQTPFKEGMREEGEEEFLFLPPSPTPSRSTTTYYTMRQWAESRATTQPAQSGRATAAEAKTNNTPSSSSSPSHPQWKQPPHAALDEEGGRERRALISSGDERTAVSPLFLLLLFPRCRQLSRDKEISSRPLFPSPHHPFSHRISPLLLSPPHPTPSFHLFPGRDFLYYYYYYDGAGWVAAGK